jgi:hypothetical protein
MSSIRFSRVVVSACTAATMFATQLEAQQRRAGPPQHRRERPALSLEVGGLFSSQTGDALGTVGDGTGFDIMGSIGSGMFSLGGGYQRQAHRRSIGGDAVVSGAFIEPRLALPLAAGNFTPYVFARGARLTRRVSGSPGEPTVNGTAIGGGIGTLFWLAPNVQLNTSLLWQDLRFDHATGLELPVIRSERAEGSQWAIRAGLTIGFDNWGR